VGVPGYDLAEVRALGSDDERHGREEHDEHGAEKDPLQVGEDGADRHEGHLAQQRPADSLL
jgi:hypothetical protein